MKDWARIKEIEGHQVLFTREYDQETDTHGMITQAQISGVRVSVNAGGFGDPISDEQWEDFLSKDGAYPLIKSEMGKALRL